MFRYFLILFFTVIFCCNLSAQEKEKEKEEDIQYPQMPINEVTGEIKYTDIVQVGGVAPDELYNRSLKWFELYFNPKSVSSLKKPKYENPTSVVQVKDPDKKIIIANATFQIYKTLSSAIEATPVAPKGGESKPKSDTTKTTPAETAPVKKETKPPASANPAPEQPSTTEEEKKAIAGDVIYTLKIQIRDGRYKYEVYDIHWDKKSYFGIEQWLDKKSPNKTEYISYLQQTNTYFNELLENLAEGMQKSAEVPNDNDW